MSIDGSDILPDIMTLKTYKINSEIFLHSSPAYVFSLTWLRYGKMNIDVMYTLIKVINFVEINALSTESYQHVQGPDI